MNKILASLLAAVLLVSAVPAAAASKVEDEIRTLEQRMNDAYAKNDLPTYFSYYALDFVQWLPEGRTDLAQYRKEWTDYVAAGNKVQAVEIRDAVLRVSPAEDAVVFQYVLYVKTKLADGKITEEENQETDVWLKRNGEWKVVALHYSPVPKKT